MANVETLSNLERRVSMTLPAQDIERQIDARLKQLARNTASANLVQSSALYDPSSSH